MVPAPTAPPAPQPEVAPPPPAVYTVSGTVSNIPAGVTVTVLLRGASGTYSTTVQGADTVNYAITGVPAGTYTGECSWDANDGSAAHIVRVPGLTVDGNNEFNFVLQ